MSYVIASRCVGTKDQSCVDVCPVDCIHDAGEQMMIDPPGASTAMPAGRSARWRRSSSKATCRPRRRVRPYRPAIASVWPARTDRPPIRYFRICIGVGSPHCISVGPNGRPASPAQPGGSRSRACPTPPRHGMAGSGPVLPILPTTGRVGPCGRCRTEDLLVKRGGPPGDRTPNPLHHDRYRRIVAIVCERGALQRKSPGVTFRERSSDLVI